MRDERRLAFGKVADLYDRVRPSYPTQLVDDVLAFAGIAGTDEVALEVGSGTGKATRLFAERGVRVHGVEPSAEMAAVARKALEDAGVPADRVEIEEGDFEHFDPGGNRYPLLFSAQAWHWVSPEVRYAKARTVLRNGGAIALFWNRPRWECSPHRQAMIDAYREAAPDYDAVGGHGPMHPESEGPSDRWVDWQAELASSTEFVDRDVRAYDFSIRYTAAEFVELLNTHSDNRLLAEWDRGALFSAISAQIERLGGEIEVAYVTDLYLARAS
jgi:SAM-dependent methyltransferase